VDAEALVRPVIEAAGYELIEARTAREGGTRILRVTVDRDGGIGLDDLGALSDGVSRALDVGGYDPGPYRLEVSSPGIERALKRPAHFRRAVGLLVKVKTTAPEAGSRTHVGALLRADDEGIALDVAGTELRVPYADIASARTVVDWDAELKRSNA
jgi:ribosome maturation factor RimP